MNNNSQVLIVGAGPVGLAAAFVLKKQGISVRVIDKQRTAVFDKTQARAITLSCRALEFLDAIGLKDKFIQSGRVCRGVTRFISNKRIDKSDFGALDELQTGIPYFLHLAQWRMQEIFIDALAELGVSVEWDNEFQSVEHSEKEVVTTVLKNGQIERITSDYLLACDGTRSAVRHALGINVVVHVEPFIVFRLIDVKIPSFSDDISKRYFHFIGDKIVFILPLYDDYQRIVTFQLKDAKPEDLNIDFFQKALDETGYTGQKIKDPLWFSEFKPISGLSERYQNGRIFLLGDSAHPISAITGQGVNTGFQDVYNFCWKLLFVIQKKAHEDLLKSYHDERYYAGKQLVDRAGRLSNSFREHLSGGIRRYIANRKIMKDYYLSNYLIEQSQLEIHYIDSNILQKLEEVKEAGLSSLQPGVRLPNFEVCTANGREPIYRFSDYDRYLLIIFSGREKWPIIKNIEVFKKLVDEKYSHLIKSICIINTTLSPSGFNAKKGWPDYVCLDVDSVHEKFVIHKPSYMLIRPDNYISCIGSLDNINLLTKYLPQI